MRPDLHAISAERRTPLLQFIKISGRPELIHVWLRCLLDCGVDLTEYGRKEAEMHREGLVTWDLEFWEAEWDPNSPLVFGSPTLSRIDTITSLAYGPIPEDWQIETQVMWTRKEDLDSMPGAWVEEQDESEQ